MKQWKKIKKLKYGNIIALLVIVLGIGFTIYASYNIIRWYLANKENAKIKEELQESIVIEKIEDPKDKWKKLNTIGVVKKNNK